MPIRQEIKPKTQSKVSHPRGTESAHPEKSRLTLASAEFQNRRPWRPVLSQHAAFWNALNQERDRCDDNSKTFAALWLDAPNCVEAVVAELSDRPQSPLDWDRITDDQGKTLIIVRDIKPAAVHDKLREVNENDAEILGAFFYPCPWHAEPNAGGFSSSILIPLETVYLSPTPVWKRAFDVVIASISLVLLSPLFLLIALVIKMGSKGPVFFRQDRLGAAGKPFKILKFRTLRRAGTAAKHQSHVTTLSRSNGRLKKLDNSASLIPFRRYHSSYLLGRTASAC